jgi:hypothetical protein
VPSVVSQRKLKVRNKIWAKTEDLFECEFDEKPAKGDSFKEGRIVKPKSKDLKPSTNKVTLRTEPDNE